MTQNRNEPLSGEKSSTSRRTVLATLGALPVLTAATSAARASDAGAVTAAATAVIDPSATRQTIRGFGGMSHAAWIGELTAAQRDTAFGTGDGRLGFSLLRIPVPEDRAAWNRDLATAKRAVELGATVIASPWNPPASMVETFVHGSQTNARRLRYDMYGAYAQHLNDFTTYLRNNGVNLYGISVQNEPDYAQDWTWWTPTEMVRFLRENSRLHRHQGHRAGVLPVPEEHVGPDPQRLGGTRQRGHHRGPPLRHAVRQLPYPSSSRRARAKNSG